MLRRVLRLANYRVSTFASGEEFLASLATDAPACVILDVHMPGLSGFDVQAHLRAMQIEIPVIFITASDAPALDKLVGHAHGTELLRKPFVTECLLNAIGKLIGKRGVIAQD